MPIPPGFCPFHAQYIVADFFPVFNRMKKIPGRFFRFVIVHNGGAALLSALTKRRAEEKIGPARKISR
jgi:hypothetical protein